MIHIVITAASLIAVVVACIVILRKAGYSEWWILVGIVPLANVVMLLVFAFRPWPIQRKLARLNVMVGEATQADFDSLLSEAVSADQRGDWREAMQLFELVLAKAADEEMKSYAEISVGRIKEKIGSENTAG